MESITCDAFLGGRVLIHQPEKGYRAGQDPVLLAAAAVLKPGERFVDLGCGVGTVGLCLQARFQQAMGVGIESDPELAALARINVSAGFDIIESDIFKVEPKPAPVVLSNPPFFQIGTGRLPANDQRRAGRHSNQKLSAWIDRAKAWVSPRGRIGFVLSTAQLTEALIALSPDFGCITVMPLVGSYGKPTVPRVLVFARQGSRSPFQLTPPFVIRDEEGALTQQACKVLNEGATIRLPTLK